MPERCPLTALTGAGFREDGDIPAVCLRTCELLWDEAIKTTQPYVTTYDEDDESSNCSHAELVFSHETLQSKAVGSATRFYATVYQCSSHECEVEIMESSYTFTCPNP